METLSSDREPFWQDVQVAEGEVTAVSPSDGHRGRHLTDCSMPASTPTQQPAVPSGPTQRGLQLSLLPPASCLLPSARVHRLLSLTAASLRILHQPSCSLAD